MEKEVSAVQEPKFNYGKLFLIGFGFFGTSVLWSLYNVYVPLLLSQRFGLDSVAIGFFMSIDNIAALFIQPPVGAWSDRVPPNSAAVCLSFGWRTDCGSCFGLIPLLHHSGFRSLSVTTILAMALRTPVVC